MDTLKNYEELASSHSKQTEVFPNVKEPFGTQNPHWPSDPPPAYDLNKELPRLPWRFRLLKTRRVSTYVCAGIIVVMFLGAGLAIVVPIALRHQQASREGTSPSAPLSASSATSTVHDISFIGI